MPDFFLGRQPIFDADLNVFGYELLYRPADQGNSGTFDGDRATSEVLLNSFVEIGLPRVVGRRQAFFNLTRHFVLNPELLPPTDGQVVLEILEDVEIDRELIEAVSVLSERGYRIALDDFVYDERFEPLLPMADIVKLELPAIAHQDLERHVERLRRGDLKLLAEKIETAEELEHCKTLGIDLYQGYFLCRPSNMRGKRLPTNRVNLLRLMSRLQDPQTGLEELDALIAQDLTLSYKLLRYINSAVFFGRRKIGSIRHAIVFLGHQAIKNWATLITLAAVDDKPEELLTTAMVRAKMCEMMADILQCDKHGAFTVGLFSTLDALMDAPLAELLEMLPLAPELTAALLEQSGPHGTVLRNAIAYERGEWDLIEMGPLTREDLCDMYLDAIEWADQTLSGVMR